MPVIVGYDRATAPSRWSRHNATTVRCPHSCDVEAFVEWLHEFGRQTPGCVLYPTSDDVAFLIATHQATLAPLFQLYSPSSSALIEVLDKSRLWLAAQRAALPTPQTWTPADEHELAGMIGELPLPVLVKPRAQILTHVSTKGVRVDRREDLIEAWRHVHAGMAFHRSALAAAPHLDRPIVQALHDVSERIYTVDGFAAANGEILGALACVKSLQLPRRSGSGVCFEPAELDPSILDGLGRLCRDTGFVGVFDVEFAIDGDEKLLIDFNPRFYNHMAFEIRRGLPLPWLAYLAATGQEQAMREAAQAARPEPPQTSGIYAHRLPLHIMLMAQRLSGGMTRAECRGWRRWMRRRPHGLVDPAFGGRDLLPALIDIAHLLRNPRSLLRKAGQ